MGQIDYAAIIALLLVVWLIVPCVAGLQGFAIVLIALPLPIYGVNQLLKRYAHASYIVGIELAERQLGYKTR